MNVAILTKQSPDNWFCPYAVKLKSKIGTEIGQKHVELYGDYKDIPDNMDIVFLLSFNKIVPQEFLSKHKHNIVVHSSDLPCGRGFAPLSWQILEGKESVVTTLFEADGSTDAGPFYYKEKMVFRGDELYNEIRAKQGEVVIRLCLNFLYDYLNNTIPSPRDQSGPITFYSRRKPTDSKLDVDKTIREQFNLLRIVDNEHFPAFFDMKGCRYKIIIKKNGYD